MRSTPHGQLIPKPFFTTLNLGPSKVRHLWSTEWQQFLDMLKCYFRERQADCENKIKTKNNKNQFIFPIH